MDFGNVGAPEVLLLLLLGLMLFGPTDWVRWARRFGAIVGRWQRFWAASVQELQEELDRIAQSTDATDAAESANEDDVWRITM